jgi:hypothetical protein
MVFKKQSFTLIFCPMGAENSTPIHMRNRLGAEEAEDVLRIHPVGAGVVKYYRLPYCPDMEMYYYLATVIVPALKLDTSDDGDSVYYRIGWVVPHSDPEHVVTFDRDTRNCRLGEMIPPDSDLFIAPIEDKDTLVLYKNNAAS